MENTLQSYSHWDHMDIFIQYSTLNEKSRQDNDQKHTQKTS